MSDTPVKAPASPYNKNNPFLAKITSKSVLNKTGSEKETRHIVIDLSGSGLQYSPGYSIGVFGTNDPAAADELLALLALSPSAPIAQKDGSTKPLRDLLIKEYTLNRAGTKLVKALAEKLPAGAAKDRYAALVADEAKLAEFIFTRDVFDVFQDSGFKPASAEELLEMINKSVPRLYSIASSQAKHPNEVHLTVAIVRYETHGRKKKGLVSGYLADHTTLGESNVPIFVAPNKHFKLPEDPATPVIMVGPGTGIAPFRAFLEQREMDGAKGPNWLFFGDQRQSLDFLYEDEFAAWQTSGLLTKLSTAFSRDQAQKVYVQDRMKENAAELWSWLQKGAYFYVCGDAKRMAKDVHQTLIAIAQEHGGMSLEAATEYIEKTLAKDERRYLRDVY